MGCCSATPHVRAPGARGPECHHEGRNVGDLPSRSPEDDEEAIGDEVKDHVPEPSLPTLLESAFQFARSYEDNLDTLSSVSSRLSTVLSIPTPSIPASHLDSVANSSVRAEYDKESFIMRRETSISGGAPSICGTIDFDSFDNRPRSAYQSADGSNQPAPSECPTIREHRFSPPQSICGSVDERRSTDGVSHRILWDSSSEAVAPIRTTNGSDPSVCGTLDFSYSFKRERDPSICGPPSICGSSIARAPSVCSGGKHRADVTSIGSNVDADPESIADSSALPTDYQAYLEAQEGSSKEGPPLDGSCRNKRRL